MVSKIENPTRPVRVAPAPERMVIRDIWLTYIRDGWPGIPDSALAGGRREIQAYYDLVAKMPDEARHQIPSPRTLFSVIQSMRRLAASEEYALNRHVDELQPIDWRKYVLWRLQRTIPGGIGITLRTPSGPTTGSSRWRCGT